MFNKEILKLYFICGTTTCNNKNLEQVVEEALRGGITSFQFREKGDGALVGFQKEELAREIQKLCKLYLNHYHFRHLFRDIGSLSYSSLFNDFVVYLF